MYSKCTVHTCTRIVVKLLLHMYEGNTHVTGLQLYNVYLLYVHSYESTFKVQLLSKVLSYFRIRPCLLFSFVHESSIVCTRTCTVRIKILYVFYVGDS
jgi:hypothetical protein